MHFNHLATTSVLFVGDIITQAEKKLYDITFGPLKEVLEYSKDSRVSLCDNLCCNSKATSRFYEYSIRYFQRFSRHDRIHHFLLN